MARPSLKRSDYISLAKARGLEWIGGKTPGSVNEPTKWRCLNCGTESEKTYRAVNYNPNGNGCACRNGVSKQPQEYHALAASLGITWAGLAYSKSVPRNTKKPTIWLSRVSKEPVEATYQQLGYGKISRELQKQLEIPDEMIARQRSETPV